jgi:integration host factor subunit beta
MMLKSELIHQISVQKPHLRVYEVRKVVDTILEEITLATARSNRVEIRGFGAFSVRRREARDGRNPRTGAEVAVRKKRALHFRAGKEISERLNREQG